jgi:CelD/BcsL family acetyltransferase involved in cellulose biosynthesis
VSTISTPTLEPAPVLTVRSIETPEALEALRNDWDALVESSGSDIYFTVDWLLAWWSAYGKGRRFLALWILDGETPVAALPFCISRVWAGPVPVRLARFVGADSTLPVFTPAIAAGYEEGALRVALQRLLTGAHAVSLSPLSGESGVAAAAERVSGHGPFELVRSDSTGTHTVWRLPASFDAYLASLGKSQRQNHRRFLRQLNAKQEVSYRTVSGEDAIAYFDRFLKLHAAHWQARGKSGHFGDWPGSEAFNRELIKRMAQSGRARFYEMAAGEQTLAIEYSFVLGDRCYWRLPGRDPDPELEKVRLGRLSLGEMFRVLIEDGRTMVEGGPGHYEYKVRLGAEEHPLRRVVISAGAGRRTGLLLRWSDLLHLVYYRAWFLKVAPRLRLSGRPLSRRWIRTRI